jgi:DNA-damage-inducible protein D
MGGQELAANLFRIKQTEAKIKNESLRGRRQLERAAEMVGQKVRHTMIETSGTYPENLPAVEDIRHVRSGLKGTHREFVRLDKPKKHPA